VDGFFVLKDGVSPSTMLAGLKMEEGHIVVDKKMRTSIEGVFAAGDCTGRPYQYAKAAGEGNGNEYFEMVYEGYGPSGIAVIVETLTDNKNRTAGDLRHYFDKNGGNLGQNGCVSFMFDRKGMIVIEKADGLDEDTLMMDALEAGADDFNVEDECYEITTAVESFSAVREALEANGYQFVQAEINYIPQTTTVLDDPEAVKKMEKLIDMLEENDDVQNVYHTWEMPEDEE
jgi:YebC/PmpR family DNA-binding regulatory protein